MKADNLKQRVQEEINAIADKLISLSKKIHDNPELGLNEFKAAKWLTAELEGEFEVERGIGEMPTAFRATHRHSLGKPTIALLAEYDALPGLGHACGHNLIATAGLGAALGLSALMSDLTGTLQLIGTPAEETVGGKVQLVEKGVFKDVDAAMMFHPAGETVITAKALALKQLKISFTGRAAHAAASPEKGLNALEGVLLTFSSINALRQHIKDEARIHGIITEGGRAPNIVPEYAEAMFEVRALTDEYLDELVEKVKNCASGAALATGTKVSIEFQGYSFKALKSNSVLERLFGNNLEQLGIKTDAPEEGLGSTDMGNVSQEVPAIHPMVAIGSKDLIAHTPEFAQAAVSEQGHQGMITAAKALAMTAIDLFTSPDLMEKARREFNGQ